jgi:hypothetical protein
MLQPHTQQHFQYLQSSSLNALLRNLILHQPIYLAFQNINAVLFIECTAPTIPHRHSRHWPRISTRLLVVPPIYTTMCDPTFTLLRWPHHDWPSNTELIAAQVLDNDISDMNRNSIAGLYSDFRSLSRSAHRDVWKRKKQRVLNPIFRSKHCAYHRDCLAFSRPHLSSRRRRWRSVSDECTEDAYWERECAELEVRERMEYADAVTLYYNHGCNAEVIERLRPSVADYREGSGGDEDDDALAGTLPAAQEWVSVYLDEAEPEPQHEAEYEVYSTGLWEICLYPAPHSTPVTTLQKEVSNLPSKDAGHHAILSTAFTYHRNLTGVWELGYMDADLNNPLEDPYGCTQLPLMLDCGCCSFNAGFFACSCAEFPKDWRNPEEPWQGILMDMVSDEVVQSMRLADTLHVVKQQGFKFSWRRESQASMSHGVRNESKQHVGCEEWTFVRPPQVMPEEKEDWDVVSELSSTGSWRVVDVT